MIIYSDFNNEYKLLDFLISHNQLLLRSMKNRARDYNIDVIFIGVSNIMMNTEFVGLEVSYKELNASESIYLEKFGLVKSEEYKIFSLIDTTGKTCYVNALSVNVFHNSLDIIESSIESHNNYRPGNRTLRFPESLF